MRWCSVEKSISHVKKKREGKNKVESSEESAMEASDTAGQRKSETLKLRLRWKTGLVIF